MSPVDELVLRDGPACVWCGHVPWRANLTVEHLLPRARRGRTTPENLALACRPCNRRRRTQAVSAHVRAQRAAGRRPRVDLLVAALERLARSEAPGHAAYGARQLALLQRLG